MVYKAESFRYRGVMILISLEPNGFTWKIIPEQAYHCELCPTRSFANLQNVETHITTKHWKATQRPVASHWCPICGTIMERIVMKRKTMYICWSCGYYKKAGFGLPNENREQDNSNNPNSSNQDTPR